MSTLNLRNFSDDLHHAVRVAAAEEDISLVEWMERASRQYLERQWADDPVRLRLLNTED